MLLSGYTAAAAGYLALVVALLVWRDRLAAGWLALALLSTLGWLATIVVTPVAVATAPEVRFFLEIARNFSWLAYLLAIYASLHAPDERIRAARAALVVLLAFAWLCCDALWPSVQGMTLRFWYVPYGIGASIAGLVLAEQILRNAPPTSRWAVKYLCFAMFLTFGFDLFLYARALLDGAVDQDLDTARGFVLALMVFPLALALRRNPSWRLDGVVSHNVVFYTATLTAVGVYLIMIGIAGTYIRSFGGTWGGVAQAVFFAAAAVGLCAVAFSSTVRARINVYVRKNFFRFKYDYRSEWLRFSKTLADPVLPTLQARAIKAIGQVVDSPGGTLWVRSEVQPVFLPEAAWQCALDANQRVRVAEPLIELMTERRWIVNFSEYRDRPELYAGQPLPAIFAAGEDWLLVPLLAGETLLGFVSLARPEVVPALNFEDHDLLRTMGEHVATHLRQLLAEQRVTEGRQFDTFSRLSAFMMHDISNILAQLSMVVKNAEVHKTNPDFVDDMIETVTASTARMERLLGQLRGGEPDIVQEWPLAELVQEAAERCQLREPPAVLGSIDPEPQVAVDRGRFVRILEHLLRNAQDATAASGTVEISCDLLSGFAVIRIADTGSGMSPAFINEVLFTPFQSTKGSQGMGIGAYQALEYVRQLGGDIEVDSEEGRGTTFSLLLPRVSPVTASPA
ncbi:MAG: XrtA/PEP-CTERM system histidine kinase PrsK [Pseudomonadota bacterium]